MACDKVCCAWRISTRVNPGARDARYEDDYMRTAVLSPHPQLRPGVLIPGPVDRMTPAYGMSVYGCPPNPGLRVWIGSADRGGVRLPLLHASGRNRRPPVVVRPPGASSFRPSRPSVASVSSMSWLCFVSFLGRRWTCWARSRGCATATGVIGPPGYLIE